MVLAVAVLACLISATFWCAYARSRPAAWVVLLCSAVWLPTNNRHLEGHTVLTLSRTHGITESDLVGVVCWLFATAVLVTRAVAAAPAGNRSNRAVIMVGTAGIVFALGALVAYAEG